MKLTKKNWIFLLFFFVSMFVLSWLSVFYIILGPIFSPPVAAPHGIAWLILRIGFCLTYPVQLDVSVVVDLLRSGKAEPSLKWLEWLFGVIVPGFTALIYTSLFALGLTVYNNRKRQK